MESANLLFGGVEVGLQAVKLGVLFCDGDGDFAADEVFHAGGELGVLVFQDFEVAHGLLPLSIGFCVFFFELGVALLMIIEFVGGGLESLVDLGQMSDLALQTLQRFLELGNLGILLPQPCVSRVDAVSVGVDLLTSIAPCVLQMSLRSLSRILQLSVLGD